MSATTAMLGLAAGLVIAAATAPVGVSGAVFLLPVQLSVLQVPSPAVTPTNLLFNVVATPGALLRYNRRHSLCAPLTRRLIAGTVPGIIAGAIIRVYTVPGPRIFRLLVAAFMLPLGAWLILQTLRPPGNQPPQHEPSGATITLLASIVGVIGGIYGIGGGSLMGPILAGRGIPIAKLAPAALASTLLTSITGALTYALLALIHTGHSIAPDFSLGLACGAGGLLGGYLGAWLQPRIPEQALRLLLAAVAIALAALYITQATG